MTTISVAMCTSAGGQRFVGEQVASIVSQRRPPDELVVSDDASPDATLDVVREAAAAATFPVRIVRNPARLGATGNFEQAIRQASGDVIALCDQDDVWLPDKLAAMEGTLAARPSAGAVFSDAELVDGDLRPLGLTMWEGYRFTSRDQDRFERGDGSRVLMRRNVVGGATMAFRSELRPLILPIPPTGLHDIWIAILVTAVSEVALIRRPLMQYRQHGANEVGGGRLLRATLEERRATDPAENEMAHFAAARERLLAHHPERAATAIHLLDRKIAHLRARADLPPRRWARVVPVLRQVASGSYARYSRGWRSCGYDLFFRT